MGTRATTFNAKIRTLRDYYHQIINFAVPATSGFDVANTMKYFAHTLLSIIKDVQQIPGEIFYGTQPKDQAYLSKFPNLNYSELCATSVRFLDVIHLVTTGQTVLAESLLQLLRCLVPFLEYDSLSMLPSFVAGSLASMPVELQTAVVDLLCSALLPNALGIQAPDCYAAESVTSILTMVLQYCRDASHHTQVVECLLPRKPQLHKDLMAVIAYGPRDVMVPAAVLLLTYWPRLVPPAVADIRTPLYERQPWAAPLCQRENCINLRKTNAVKICTHPQAATTSTGGMFVCPPLFVCIDCYDILKKDYASHFLDMLMPADSISTTCENKNCSATDNHTVAVCASLGCAATNRFRPLSLCATCNISRHAVPPSAMRHMPLRDRHVVQEIGSGCVWSCDVDVQFVLVDTIVGLLREAEAACEGSSSPATGGGYQAAEEDRIADEERVQRELISRYGIWMIATMCRPREELHVELLGRVIAALFRWFQCTTNAGSSVASSALEKLKTEFACSWLQEVKKTHYELILSSLLPHPPDFARVGGQWERLSSRAEQIKEGLEKFNCLGPYDIVTYEVWDYVMPYWLESIRTELNLKEREEVKGLLSKTFDVLMSPLPFLLDKMYHFIDERFESDNPLVQEQGLQWLQILSSVGVPIPVVMLVKMFRGGVAWLMPSEEAAPAVAATAPPKGVSGAAAAAVAGRTQEPIVRCLVLMLDVLLKQMELGKDIRHAGVNSNKSKETFLLLTAMVETVRRTRHTCSVDAEDCPTCDLLIIFYRLASDHVAFIVPKLEIRLPVNDVAKQTQQQQQQQLHDNAIGASTPQLSHAAHATPLSAASPEPPAAAASGSATSAAVEIAELPPILQLFRALLKELDSQPSYDVLHYVALSVKLLFAHAECLQTHAKSQLEAQINTCVEQEFVPRIWRCLHAEHCDVSAMCVHMLLHCVALPRGNDAFWTLVDESFGSDDWRERSVAAERVRLLWEFTNCNMIMKNQVVVTALAHAFCLYVDLLQDAEARVAQLATLQLGTMKVSSLQCMVWCLEAQYDVMISDRQLVLRALTRLQSAMPDRPVLSWQFFILRLQLLFLEAHITGSPGFDFPQFQGGGHSDPHHLDQMMKRAQFSTARSESVNSIAELSGKKRRATSVPSVQQHEIKAGRRAVQRATTATAASTRRGSQILANVNDESRRPVLSSGTAAGAPTFRVGSGGGGTSTRGGLSYVPMSKSRSYSRGKKAASGADSASTPIIGELAFMLIRPLCIFKEDILNELTSESGRYVGSLQKAVETNAIDHNDLHQLVSAIVDFMAHQQTPKAPVSNGGHGGTGGAGGSGGGGGMAPGDEQVDPSEEAVLEQVFALMGYNLTDKKFLVMPKKIRQSPVFDAVIGGLNRFLDGNMVRGRRLLLPFMQLLQFSASPQKYASDFQAPTYSLWHLDPRFRRPWLLSVLTILYKYDYHSGEASSLAAYLVRVAVNTVKAQVHVCADNSADEGESLPGPAASSVLDQSRAVRGPNAPLESSDFGHGHAAVSAASASSPSSGTGAGSSQDARMAYSKKPLEESIQEEQCDQPSPGSPKALHGKRWPHAGSAAASPAAAVAAVEQLPLTAHLPLDSDKSKGNKRAIFKRQQTIDLTLEDQSASAGKAAIVAGGCSEPLSQPLSKSQVPRAPGTKSEIAGGASAALSGTAEDGTAAHGPRAAVPVTRSATAPESTDGSGVGSGSCVRPSQAVGSGSCGHGTAGHGVLRKLKKQSTIERNGPDDAPSGSGSAAGTTAGASGGGVASAAAGNGVGGGASARGGGSTTPKFLHKLQGSWDSCRNFAERADNVLGLTEEEKSRAVATAAANSAFLARSKPKGPFVGRPVDRSSRVGSMAATSAATAASASGSRSVPGTPVAERRRDLSSSAALHKICDECGLVVEEYDEETISLCIVAMETYVYRELAAAAPFLFEMVMVAARIAARPVYCWQAEDESLIVPGNSLSCAQQFLRCVLHQLTPNGILVQLFLHVSDSSFFVTVAKALADFPELSSQQALLQVLEGLNARKELPESQLLALLNNLDTYLHAVAGEGAVAASASSSAAASASAPAASGACGVGQAAVPPSAGTAVAGGASTSTSGVGGSGGVWGGVLAQLDALCRRLPALLPRGSDASPFFGIMSTVFGLPGIQVHRFIVDGFSKALSIIVQKHSFKVDDLTYACWLCNKCFSKERDRTGLGRTVVLELAQMLKLKTMLPEMNSLILLQLLCLDYGSVLLPSNIANHDASPGGGGFSGTAAAGSATAPSPYAAVSSVSPRRRQRHPASGYWTAVTVAAPFERGAAEAFKPLLADFMEFVADQHALTKLKENLKVMSIHEDTLGGLLKLGVAQVVALEFTRLLIHDRTVSKLMPWLYHPPATLQGGPREFTETVDHVRFVSWLFIGALSHRASVREAWSGAYGREPVNDSGPSAACQPLPLEDGQYLADLVINILTGFAEYSKASVEHMSSLFYAFTLCQAWTMYCEAASLDEPVFEPTDDTGPADAIQVVHDFWIRVTPAILNLMSVSRALAERVNLHMLSLMENLQECQSTVLSKLFTLWRPILYSQHSQLPTNIRVRLQTIENWEPPKASTDGRKLLLEWVRKMQFKLAQTEVQSSTAAQFYVV